ncbi:MAG: serine protease [Myxococcota bacterium]|nr:serine protease [Myxococcota bacterium]
MRHSSTHSSGIAGLAWLVTLFLSLFTVTGCADLSGFEEDELSSKGKILGGESAKAPSWMVSIRVQGQHNCGGTLIKSNWVLTAAHCVDTFPAQVLSVCVGRTRTDRCRSKDVGQVEEIKIHSDWDRSSPRDGNDIAVIRLNRNFNQENTVPLAKAKQEPRSGELVRARGWGVAGYRKGGDRIAPKRLQQIQLPYLNPSDCAAEWEDVGVETPRRAVRNFACTETLGTPGYVTTGGVCNGDSGGPLTAGGRQIGIASFVPSINDYCIAGAPANFTRVSQFRSWIREQAR